jgi:hypothetical protein
MKSSSVFLVLTKIRTGELHALCPMHAYLHVKACSNWPAKHISYSLPQDACMDVHPFWFPAFRFVLAVTFRQEVRAKEASKKDTC